MLVNMSSRLIVMRLEASLMIQFATDIVVRINIFEYVSDRIRN